MLGHRAIAGRFLLQLGEYLGRRLPRLLARIICKLAHGDQQFVVVDDRGLQVLNRHVLVFGIALLEQRHSLVNVFVFH
jgi:hypothetical protein